MDHRRLLLLSLLVLVAGCSSAPRGDVGLVQEVSEPEVAETVDRQVAVRAEHVCSTDAAEFVAREYAEPAASLVASYPTSVARFEAWADARHGPAGGADLEPDSGVDAEFAVLCLFDGDFAAIPQGPPPGEEPIAFTRISILAVPGGELRLYGAGRPETMPLADEVPPPSPPGIR